MNDYTTYRRNLKLGITVKPEKPKPKPIAKRSEKLKELFKGYKKQVKAFLTRPENLRCKAMWVCNGAVSEDVHHQSGRIGAKLKDESDWLPVCRKCHRKIHDEDSEARERGLLKSRFTKTKK